MPRWKALAKLYPSAVDRRHPASSQRQRLEKAGLVTEHLVFLVVITALLIAAIWYAGVRKRAVVSGELQRQYAEQAAKHSACSPT